MTCTEFTAQEFRGGLDYAQSIFELSNAMVILKALKTHKVDRSAGTAVLQTSANNKVSCSLPTAIKKVRFRSVMVNSLTSRKDILPSRTLPALLEEFDSKLPHAPNQKLCPIWCLKYTVLIRDRGVLADKG